LTPGCYTGDVTRNATGVPLEVQHKGSYGGISSSDHDQFRKDFQMIKQLLALLGGPRIFASKTQLLPLLSLFILIVAACAGGQAPEASKARSRAVIKAGDIVPAEEIRVAEYLKYYEQHFPESAVSTLGLDLRPGNVQLPVQGGHSLDTNRTAGKIRRDGVRSAFESGPGYRQQWQYGGPR
jgi:hypothetical protein